MRADFPSRQVATFPGPAQDAVVNEELPRDYLDRFSGLARLHGADALPRLRRARVAVIGTGGVGSWTAEALARSGVGSLFLVDPDEICVTNTNRQLPALAGHYGRLKIEAIAERLRAINPAIEVEQRPVFLTADSADGLLGGGHDVVVDGIDDAKLKALLVAACRERGLPLVVSGGAGGKRNPASVRTADLAFATNDRLLRLVRKELRRRHGYPPEDSKDPFGARAVFSVENARYPWSDGSVRDESEPNAHLRLNCETGFGTAAPVTNAFGLAAAAEAVAILLGEREGGAGRGLV
jgi:tRNA A37 threonylcarbamoyladenosine dehydratase